QYVRKGMQIMVTGEIDASAFVGQDGQARASLDLTAQNVQFLGSRGDRMEESGEYYGNNQQVDDLPF
ncbi:MAG: single-stranded DNA-binding protein, partial [Chloroflexota bacterium]